MTWPKDLHNIVCYGFPSQCLPVIKAAIENNEVKWGSSSGFAELIESKFEYLNCTWKLVEFCELVEEIQLVSGIPDSEDFTAAILKTTEEK